MLQEIGHQLLLLARQRDRHHTIRRVDLQLAGLGIEPVGPHLQQGLAIAGLAALQRSHPGQQFLHGEGFAEVVVSARIEPLHPIGRLSPGGEQQQGQLESGRAGPAAELRAAQARQHPIHDHQLIASEFTAQERPALHSIGAMVDHMALALQHGLHGAGQLLLIFHQQDPQRHQAGA